MAKSTRVAFVSLGCPKNTVDSEKMLGQLAEAGCEITSCEREADVVVINTCGFLQTARAEAVAAISDLVKTKRRKGSRLQRVVVAGCLVQRDGEGLLETVPGIDALVGVHRRDDVLRAVMSERRPRKSVDTYLGDYHPFVSLDTARLRITPRHWAYLRISEGCNQKCTFCTIPAIRGPLRCKPPELVLAEARELLADGAVELVLIGQDTTSYGTDLGYREGLAGLLRRLNDLEGLSWLRLMYVYPSVFTDGLIEAIAECEKVVKYVDLPLQHINDRILKAMHRRIDRQATVDLLQRIRRWIPEVHLRTTLISGFPGETQAQHEELVDFVRAFEFDALGVFPYSREEETPAARMPGQLPAGTIEQRVEELMLAQQKNAFALAERRIDHTFDVLVEAPPCNGAQQTRHSGQAPEVDSVTWLQGTDYPPGTFHRVRCTGRDDYDLLARPSSIALPTMGRDDD